MTIQTGIRLSEEPQIEKSFRSNQSLNDSSLLELPTSTINRKKPHTHHRHHSHCISSTFGISSSSSTSITRTNKVATRKVPKQDILEDTPFLQAFFTYLSYTILHIFGHLREFLRRIGFDQRKGAVDSNPKVI